MISVEPPLKFVDYETEYITSKFLPKLEVEVPELVKKGDFMAQINFSLDYIVVRLSYLILKTLELMKLDRHLQFIKFWLSNQPILGAGRAQSQILRDPLLEHRGILDNHIVISFNFLQPSEGNEVYPNLFIGGKRNLRNKEWLKSSNIKYIINVAHGNSIDKYEPDYESIKGK